MKLQRPWEAHHVRRCLIQQLSQLTAASERWRQSFPQVREFDGQRSMPELPRFAVELDRRFAEIGDMLDGQSARAPAIDHFRCRRCGLQSA